MPYISSDDREHLRPEAEHPEGGGGLTYQFTMLSLQYVGRNGRSFSTFCVVIGALVCTVFEFYRRVVAPYEDQKCKTNGDVY